MNRITLLISLLLLLKAAPGAGHGQCPAAAQRFRQGNHPVEAVSDTTIIAEAEEFQPAAPGWQAKGWGTNYYCATFANSFLSRKTYLSAPEQCEGALASLTVRVPKSGRYMALVRYEAVYRFETQFRLRVEQHGRTRLDRLCGARDNVKVWAFREKLKKEVAWPWGAGENIVWEGHDAFVDLDAGTATVSLAAARQPEPAARRNVDLVLLTTDHEQVRKRIDTENYLPLDGLLTQAGDVYLKLHNRDRGSTLTLTIPHGTEHSPYWVHLREWQPKTVTARPGESTDWVEVGSLLDTLNDGQWPLTVKGLGAVLYDLEFGVRGTDGKIAPMRRFVDLRGNMELAYQADTRYSRTIGRTEDALYELVDFLKKHPVSGTRPRRALIYGYTFPPRPGDDRYNAALAEFLHLMGATALGRDRVEDVNTPAELIRGYIDVRGQNPQQLAKLCDKLKAAGKADRIAVVSLGDEIGLASPPLNDHAGFRAWLKAQNVRPTDLDAAAGNDVEKISYSPTPETAKLKPALYYYSKIYGYRYGIQVQKSLTDVLRKHLPNAGIGANFSPHHHHMYLGDTHHWISVFREDGMTMPWGEDYIWQVPVATQQMNFLMVDMFRAGIRGKPGAKIHYYVMPHTPGNTPASWRRQFYGDLAHGVKVFNLFEFRPVQAAYTENHTSDPVMYQAVRQALHELGRCEDIVQDGQLRPGQAALWFSEAADVWDDNRSPLDAAKRMLFIAIRHQQLPLDVVVEGDDLKPYQILYLTDSHVSRAAAQAIVAWVQGGGRLFATANAGMYDEFNQPNAVMRELLGVTPRQLQEAPGGPIRFGKQDLPWAEPIDTVTLRTDSAEVKLAALGLVSRCTRTADAAVMAAFADGSPAVLQRREGKGRVMYCAFLPGLSYFKPALPRRPVDRGATDDALSHFVPTRFDRPAAGLIAALADFERPVVCSEPLVETTVIESKHGVLLPLVNWSAAPVQGLKVTVRLAVPTRDVSLASGKPVRTERRDGKTTFTLDLDVADALILR